MEQKKLLNDFIALLDAHRATLLRTAERLDTLRAAVIRRDEEALSSLLAATEQETAERTQLDAARQQIENHLVAAFQGRLSPPITISTLCGVLKGDEANLLRQKQADMLELAGRLQDEHKSTELLLRECARCNRQLLSAILGQNPQSVTYGPRGHSQWDMRRGLVSMKV